MASLSDLNPGILLGAGGKGGILFKALPSPSSNTSVFPGFSFYQLLFIQLLTLARWLVSWEMVFLCVCVKETQSQVPQEYY